MVRLAISELTTLRWSLEEDVAQYCATGACGIGVWRPKLADVGDEKGAALLGRSGLTVSSLQWAGGFTGSDGRSFEESLADARLAIQSAEKLKAACLIIHSGARGVHTHSHARRLIHLALAKLLPLAEERGIKLAVEPMNGDCGAEFTFLNCLDETLELIRRCDSAALGIALDTYYWGHCPALLDKLPQLAPHLALVQLADSREPPSAEPNRCQLGEGAVPLAAIVRRLRAAGYDGFFEIELMGEEIEAANYREVLAHSARAYQALIAP